MSSFIRKTLSFFGLTDEDDNLNRHADGDKGQEKIKTLEKREHFKNNTGQKNMNRFKPRRGSLLHSVKRDEKKSRVFIIEPHEFEEVQVIGENFKDDTPIIVNLQKTNSDLSKRIIDFCSGITFALEGSIMKVADKVFLITPYNVEVTSEEKEILKEKGLFNQI